MKKLVLIIPIVLILLLALIVIIINTDKNSTKNNISSIEKKINIVAAENFYGDVASQIAGNNANTISILSNPNLDPHAYEATTEDARNITNADIIIENGIGYDTFMEKLLSTAGNKEVINVGALVGLTENDNPHIWYNLDSIRGFAIKLKDELIKVDKTNQNYYQDNYINFLNSLSQIDNACQNIKSNFNNTKVIATERVADFLLIRCGLNPIKNVFQKAIEEGNDPSIDSISFFENILNAHQSKILIYNNQTQSQLTEKEKALAVKNNIPVVGITETMPLATTYVNWMINELNDINTALKK